MDKHSIRTAADKIAEIAMVEEDRDVRAALWLAYHGLIATSLRTEPPAALGGQAIAIETDEGVARYGL